MVASQLFGHNFPNLGEFSDVFLAETIYSHIMIFYSRGYGRGYGYSGYRGYGRVSYGYGRGKGLGGPVLVGIYATKGSV
jgi:hypothetical protein